MATVEKVPMLAEGHAALSDELQRLRLTERPSVISAIEEARAHGDLSENAEYHAAKERQGQVEASIADLEDKLARGGDRSDDLVGRQGRVWRDGLSTRRE